MSDEKRIRAWPGVRELPAILPPGAVIPMNEGEETAALTECCRLLGDLPAPIARRVTIYLMQRFGHEVDTRER